MSAAPTKRVLGLGLVSLVGATIGVALVLRFDRRHDLGRALNTLTGRRGGVESPTYATDPDSAAPMAMVDPTSTWA